MLASRGAAAHAQGSGVRADSTGKTEEGEFNPKDHGFPLYTLDDLHGGTAEDNAEEAKKFLTGTGKEAIRDAVLLNAGAALFVYGAAESIIKGYQKAEQALVSGKVAEKVEEIIAGIDEIGERNQSGREISA